MNENEIIKLTEKLCKGKPINIFIRVISAVSVISGLIAMFLPFGKVMYYHPETFSILNLGDYKTNNILLLLSIVIGLISTLIVVLSINWVEKRKISMTIKLNVLGTVLCFIMLLIFALAGEMALYNVESYCDMRVDKSIAYYAGYICLFIPLILNAVSGIIVFLISSGKVSVEKMFGEKCK